MRKIVYRIDENDKDLTILSFLKRKQYSHQVITNLKKTTCGIMHNDTWAYINETLAFGDSLTITLADEPASPDIPASFHPFEIIYEDEDLIAINKPSSMPIHPSQGHHDGTLANALAFYNQQQGICYPFRCINRLDRDTTGLTVVAKHPLSAAILGQQIRTHTMQRIYVAICQGCIPLRETIDAPIARKNDSTIMREVNPSNGENAITHVCRISYRKDLDLSLCALRLETGRTHQIRVHMSHIGHPLIGDFLYHPKENAFLHIKRQALHACQLKLIHPVTTKPLILYAPIPKDMSEFFPAITEIADIPVP